ncbi:CorA family divalent cation transporter [Streptomyces sp. NPDC003860]
MASLRKHWVQVPTRDAAALAKAERTTGADFATAGERVWEGDAFVYLPITINVRSGAKVRREPLVFALGDDVLVTLQPEVPFAPFDKALARLRRLPHLAQSAHGVMYALLYALNEAQERVIDCASDALEAMSDEITLVITAVFLPPTLIATFYGMNFTNMPELAWEHGFLATTLLTFVAALIPLWCIRRRGWLR